MYKQDSALESCPLGMWTTTSLPLLPGPLYLGVVVPVRVPPMDQIEICNHFLNLKPFNLNVE